MDQHWIAGRQRQMGIRDGLLFDDAPKALVDKVEQVARLIRSKGVGVYFVTQNPADVPEDVLGQLGNRIQHALRAFTARDRKELRQAAQT